MCAFKVPPALNHSIKSIGIEAGEKGIRLRVTRPHPVFMYAQVRDLSVLACVCMELRQLADADHLWKPPFLREFPNASLEERSMAERLGYKQVYITLWRVSPCLALVSRTRQGRRGV